MALSLPLLGMGTWGMGGTFRKDPSNFDESVEALRFGFELGIRLVDVAELHGEGLTEEIVAQAMKGFTREDIFIISKVSREHLRYDDVLKAAEGSLKRLGTDYIDLYLVHKLPPEMPEPLPETFAALERLYTQGIVRRIGVSNFSKAHLEQSSRFLTEATLAANEVEYNLLYQNAAREVIPYCREKCISVIAHRPFGKGELFQKAIPLLDEIAKKYKKTIAQVALNWLISQGITAIPKASSQEHIRENLGALGWEIEAGDIELLRALDASVPYEEIKQ